MILAIVLVLVVIGITGALRNISELKEQVAELKNEMTAVEVKNRNLINKNAQLEVAVYKITETLAANADAANKKIERLEKTGAALKKTIKNRDKEYAAAIENTLAAVTGLKNDLTKLKGYIAELNGANTENLVMIVDEINEIIDGHNDQEKKIIEMEKNLTELKNKKNKKRCPLPPWRKHKTE